MTVPTFAPGDTVILKSGGPTMTIEKIAKSASGETLAWCIWFDGSKRCSDTFPPSSLKAYE